jgi:hypothetical protein
MRTRNGRIGKIISLAAFIHNEVVSGLYCSRVSISRVRVEKIVDQWEVKLGWAAKRGSLRETVAAPHSRPHLHSNSSEQAPHVSCARSS